MSIRFSLIGLVHLDDKFLHLSACGWRGPTLGCLPSTGLIIENLFAFIIRCLVISKARHEQFLLGGQLCGVEKQFGRQGFEEHGIRIGLVKAKVHVRLRLLGKAMRLAWTLPIPSPSVGMLTPTVISFSSRRRVMTVLSTLITHTSSQLSEFVHLLFFFGNLVPFGLNRRLGITQEKLFGCWHIGVSMKLLIGN